LHGIIPNQIAKKESIHFFPDTTAMHSRLR